jgi:hypothetical protein
VGFGYAARRSGVGLAADAMSWWPRLTFYVGRNTMRHGRSITIITLVTLCVAVGAGFGVEFLRQRALLLRVEASMDGVGASLRKINSLEQAELALDVWGIWMATNHYGYPTWPSYARRLSQTRSGAVSNLVVGLEGYTGLRYGTNLEAWRHWLALQSAEEAANQTVQRTGASRSARERDSTPSATGSRR